MKIGIVTIYESITNLGSFLQAYALKTTLEQWGHDVYLIQNVPTAVAAKKCILKINPKREFFLRIKKTKKFCQDMRKLKFVPKEKIADSDFDLLIYGSDEIWNLENPYFQNDLFWGLDGADVHRVAYAISVGAMEQKTMEQNSHYFKNLPSFDRIMVRDDATMNMLSSMLDYKPDMVCDPTILLPLQYMEQTIALPSKPYMLVYTYGLDEPMIRCVVNFARERGLEIVSPCFWHPWVDRVIESNALQFSSLIKGAEYVFTSTFHGAIFTLLNHKQCCILPVREKVRDVVMRLGEEQHLIEQDCDAAQFAATMSISFDTDDFEKRVVTWRKTSEKRLQETLTCLEK